jgi:hypothetical protein
MDPIIVTVMVVAAMLVVAPLVWAVVIIANEKKPAEIAAKQDEERRAIPRIGEISLEQAQALVERSKSQMLRAAEVMAAIDVEVDVREAKAKETAASDNVVSMHTIVERLERRVEERERIAQNPPPPQQPALSPELEASIYAVADRIKATLERGALFVHHCRTVFRVSDRNIDRAYSHLCRQVSEAHAASAVAELRHADIESMCEPVYFRLPPEEGVEDNSIAELTNTMVVLRRRNFFIGEALFRIDRVVRRLYVIKLLLSALPSSAREEVAQFRNALNAVSDYIDKVWTAKDEPSANDLYARIEHLEHRTLMVYIRIAKDKKQRRASRERLAKAISEVATKLADERSKEQSLHHEWNERALAAAIEDKKLIGAVSELRTEQCHAVLRSLERTKKVLDAVSDALSEPNQTKKLPNVGA